MFKYKCEMWSRNMRQSSVYLLFSIIYRAGSDIDELQVPLLLWSSVSYSNISLRFRTLTWYILWYQYRGIHKKRYPQTVRVRPRVILRLSKGQVSQRTSRSQANHHYFSSTQVGKLMLSTTCATWATSTTCALLEKRTTTRATQPLPLKMVHGGNVCR